MAVPEATRESGDPGVGVKLFIIWLFAASVAGFGDWPYVGFRELFEFLTDNSGAQCIPLFDLQFLLGTLLEVGGLGFHEELVDHGTVAVREKAEIDAELHEG